MTTPTKKNSLPLTIYKWHGFFIKLGPKLGSLPIRALAYYALYKVASNGGLEALSYVCYEHMFKQGEAEAKKPKGTKTNGPQAGVPKK